MHISIVLETNKNLLKNRQLYKNLRKKKRISKYNKGWTNSPSRCNSYICGQEFGTYVSQVKSAKKE